MRTETQWKLYQELELMPATTTESSTIPRKQSSWFSHVWMIVVGDPFKGAPQIEEMRDQDGNATWFAYDAVTANIAWLNSEFEVLDWIDQLEPDRLKALYQNWWRHS